MLTEPTLAKLRDLRLDAFAAAWGDQQKNRELAQLSFDERLGLLVDAECLARENKRLARLLKEAKLRLGQACIEDIDYLRVCLSFQGRSGPILLGYSGLGGFGDSLGGTSRSLVFGIPSQRVRERSGDLVQALRYRGRPNIP
jgi:hypothetical protein